MRFTSKAFFLPPCYGLQSQRLLATYWFQNVLPQQTYWEINGGCKSLLGFPAHLHLFLLVLEVACLCPSPPLLVALFLSEFAPSPKSPTWATTQFVP